MPSPSESPVQQLLPSTCLNGVPLEVELSRNHKLAEADVNSVKSWSERRYDLPSLSESDAALFLHARNYDCERAKLLLENFFGMRRRLGCFFGQRDPDSSQLRTFFNTLAVYPLEKKSHRGRTVVLARLLDTDPHRYDFLVATKYLSMVLDALIHEAGCDPGGYIFLFDLSNVTELHRNELSVSRLRNFFAYFRDCCPARWHGLHYLDLKPGEDNLCRRSKRQFAEELSIETHFHELASVLYSRSFVEAPLTIVIFVRRLVSLAPDDRQHRQDHPSGRAAGRVAGHEPAQPRRVPSASGAEARRLSRLVPPHGPDVLLLSLSRSRGRLYILRMHI
ncbi:unnamed protein product [Trichogramma brassicae]|uniref:CRAL-TRIO domain-containing protein n=1 Tax=Trichogramma brassicae TaxID=86971 RepID=A0A6H5IV50_9HYME|nr:unnamed protein product [Trichogramma brassicae]